MSELIECQQCGGCFPPDPQSGGICADCEWEHARKVDEQEQERRLDNAIACKCGAWGLYEGRVYHAADCVCGQT